MREAKDLLVPLLCTAPRLPKPSTSPELVRRPIEKAVVDLSRRHIDQVEHLVWVTSHRNDDPLEQRLVSTAPLDREIVTRLKLNVQTALR
jgi:hypothetical protein